MIHIHAGVHSVPYTTGSIPYSAAGIPAGTAPISPQTAAVPSFPNKISLPLPPQDNINSMQTCGEFNTKGYFAFTFKNKFNFHAE
jgi:hypothetical protein